MNRYVPMEITEFARREAQNYPYTLGDAPKAQAPGFERVVKKDAAFAKDDRIKMRTDGKDGFSINREEVDMRYVEQLADSEQLTALSYMIKYLKLRGFDGKKTVQECVEALYSRIPEKGWEAFCGGESIPGNLCMPRKQELYAAINRCRELVRIEGSKS
jgi:hypothetical protein